MKNECHHKGGDCCAHKGVQQNSSDVVKELLALHTVTCAEKMCPVPKRGGGFNPKNQEKHTDLSMVFFRGEGLPHKWGNDWKTYEMTHQKPSRNSWLFCGWKLPQNLLRINPLKGVKNRRGTPKCWKSYTWWVHVLPFKGNSSEPTPVFVRKCSFSERVPKKR